MSNPRLFVAFLALALALPLVGCQGGRDTPQAPDASVPPPTPPGKINARVEQEALAAVRQVSVLVGEGKVNEAKLKLADIGARYRGTIAAGQVQGIAAELAVVGKNTPQRWGIDKWFQGQSQVDLAGDKPTLLVFWETWCPHCRDEVPKIQTLYTSHKDRGLQVLAVTKAMNTTEATVKEFIASNALTYPIAQEDGSLSSYFNVTGIPAAAVVKGGKVVWRGSAAGVNEGLLSNWL
jgi:thiol-disulfide isomerase/thioredoxin